MPSTITRKLQTASRPAFTAYCIVAAFGSYFCMYAFRKPFTAGTFETVTLTGLLEGIGFKTVLVTAQVAGYTLSKFIGIKVISEMPRHRRALAMLGTVAVAEIALFFFAIVPPPYNTIMLFINGLMLGMVFGLVLAFLEGRRLTEALVAGLCASFIISSGIVKSIGRYLIEAGISEFWMPFITGLIFTAPLLFFVWLLEQIPAPSDSDVEHRAERLPMSGEARRALFGRHVFGLLGLLLTYILITVMRSIRDDFAVEIWRDLGESGKPAIFTQSELLVMFGVVMINGAAIMIRNNRSAFLGSMQLVSSGFVLVLVAIAGYWYGWLSPFLFMVTVGLGLYVPYVAFHTTVFERMIAAFREQGNIGYLMYLADTVGYLGYVGVMICKNFMPADVNFLDLFIGTSLVFGALSIMITVLLTIYFSKRIPRSESQAIVSTEVA